MDGVDLEVLRNEVDEWTGEDILNLKGSLSIMHDLDKIDPLVFK